MKPHGDATQPASAQELLRELQLPGSPRADAQRAWPQQLARAALVPLAQARQAWRQPQDSRAASPGRAWVRPALPLPERLEPAPALEASALEQEVQRQLREEVAVEERRQRA